MPGPLRDYETELAAALHRRGDPITPHDFLAILAEVDDSPAEALTDSERTFLLTETDLTESDLSADGRMATLLAVSHGRAVAERKAADDALTTAEVAALLGRAEANVRRSRINGDLYAPDSSAPGRALKFPRWQFNDAGQVTPRLRQVLAALPRYLHPLSVEQFMTEGTEALGGQSPAQWLNGGGPVDPVVRLAEELSYE